MTTRNPGKKGVATARPAGSRTSGAPEPIAVADEAGIDTGSEWEAARAEAEALPRAAIRQPSAAVRQAATLGLSVARRVQASGEREALARLAASGHFDPAEVERLARFAAALLYVRAQLERSPARSGATVPAALVRESEATRARMLKVLGFYFDDDPETGRALARIRQGSGHADLAGDLVALASLYREHRARIAQTPEHYRAADVDAATSLAGRIYALLSADDATAVWSERQARVWTVFARAYEEVSAAGRYVFRRDADVEARFPALHSVNTAPRRAPKPEKPDAPKPA